MKQMIRLLTLVLMLALLIPVIPAFERTAHAAATSGCASALPY